jgi:hypothetical protein
LGETSSRGARRFLQGQVEQAKQKALAAGYGILNNNNKKKHINGTVG